MSGIGRTAFQKYGKIIGFMSDAVGVLPAKFRKKALVAIRNKKGNFGILLRYLLLRSLARYCGENVSIRENVYLFNPENISIGDNVSIHPMCYIQPGKGSIKIGNDVSIAHGVTLIAESHQYGADDIPIKYQPMEDGSIEINDNVWIGAKATILKDCWIGSGCVIGANAVVTKSIDDNMVAVGCPARPVKRRITVNERTDNHNTNI